MKKAPISVRIIHFFSVLVFWLLGVVTVALFVGNLLLQTNIISEEFQLRIETPISFNVDETGTVELYGNENEVRIEEATGRLHIVNTPPRFSKNVAGVAFAVALVALFMAWKFKLFITNIKNGIVFESSNINNLKHIAYGILIIWFVTKIYMRILYYTVIESIKFESLYFSGKVEDDSNLLILALFLWVLAHVFMKGVEIKKEQDLTI